MKRRGILSAAGSRRAARRWAFGLWGGGLLAVSAGWGAAAALMPTAVPGWSLPPLLLAWLWVADGWMRRPGGVPCLTWHSVSADAAWLPWAAETSVHPRTLDRQLGLLRRMGCTVMDTGDFVRRRLAGRPVPDGTVLLHFDDGYLDNWVAAAPILRRHGMCATLFVSLEFAAPERPPPPTLDETETPPRWDGYLSWGEIAALDQSGEGRVFDVQPHGVDHIRLPAGPAEVGRLSQGNWRRHAWMQWAAMRGSKHDWYRAASPPAVPAGTAIPESEAALAAPAYLDGRYESTAEYSARVRAELSRCRQEFRTRLAKDPLLFCWPQNRTSELARRIAAAQGFLATTGGSGDNGPETDPSVISRVHVGENAAGFVSARIDGWHFRATVRCFQGNFYWYPLILAASLSKAVHKRLRPRRDRQRPGGAAAGGMIWRLCGYLCLAGGLLILAFLLVVMSAGSVKMGAVLVPGLAAGALVALHPFAALLLLVAFSHLDALAGILSQALPLSAFKLLTAAALAGLLLQGYRKPRSLRLGPAAPTRSLVLLFLIWMGVSLLACRYPEAGRAM